MELKYIVPNVAQTFGNLEFAGENKIEQQRINGCYTPVSRSYNLYSDIQRADDIIVTIPAKAGEKHSKPKQRVKLINPVADTVVNANYRGVNVDWYIKANDILLKNKGGQAGKLDFHCSGYKQLL